MRRIRFFDGDTWVELSPPREAADIVNLHDRHWPATSARPVALHGRNQWWEDGWPQRHSTAGWWGRGLHDELGLRAMAALAHENRIYPAPLEDAA